MSYGMWGGLAAAAISFAMGELAKRRVARRQQREREMMRSPDPAAFVSALTERMADVSAPEHVHQAAAIALLMQGETAQADSLMAQFDWSKKRDEIRAAKDGYDAVRAYLAGDYQEGYDASMRQARGAGIAVDSYDSDLPYTGAYVLVDIGRLLLLNSESAEMRLSLRLAAPVFEPLRIWALLQNAVRRGDIDDANALMEVLVAIAPHAHGLGVPRSYDMTGASERPGFVQAAPPPSWTPPRNASGRYVSRIGPWMQVAAVALAIGVIVATHWDPKPSTGRSWFELPRYPLVLDETPETNATRALLAKKVANGKDAIRRCHQIALADDANLAGSVAFDITFANDGLVESANVISDTVRSASARRCLEHVIKAIELPASREYRHVTFAVDFASL